MNRLQRASYPFLLGVAVLAACRGEESSSGGRNSGVTPCLAASGNPGSSPAGAPEVLAHVPASPTVIAVDCSSVYVAPYEIGVVTAVSLADGSQRTLNPISANSLAMDATRVYSVSPGGGNEPQGLVVACPKSGCSPSYATVATGQTNVWGIAVDSKNVYWTNQGPPGAVMMAPLAGGTPTTLVGPGSASTIVPAGENVIYSGFVNDGSSLLMSVPVAGGPAKVLFTPDGGNSVSAIAVDGSNAYFTTTDGLLGQVPLGGGAVVTLATGQGNGIDFGLAVSSTNVYWAEGMGGAILTIPIGGGAVTTLATGQPGPTGLALDAKNIYWSNMGDNTVMRMPLR